jgi:hypothetical protein
MDDHFKRGTSPTVIGKIRDRVTGKYPAKTDETVDIPSLAG